MARSGLSQEIALNSASKRGKGFLVGLAIMGRSGPRLR